ncbi:MAG TPA: pyridoxamine 5'-phosphate oxidase family protein [Desulfuromonadales bacterium]|nr:pyridoxamine 5'-phosphate oxidase family protein [Desulfuromonadales bacterium]
MRRSDREITDVYLRENLLLGGTVCRLAMVDDGEPYVVPLNYGYRDGTLYFHGASEGRMIDILRRGGRVCFEITREHGVVRHENPCSWDWQYQTVIGYGLPRFIEDVAEKRMALAIVMNQYSTGEYAFTDASVDRVIVFSVKIDSMTAKEYRSC